VSFYSIDYIVWVYTVFKMLYTIVSWDFTCDWFIHVLKC